MVAEKNALKTTKRHLCRGLILGYLGGMMYVSIELLWRGRSHPSMFFVGGLCFLIIGSINEGILTWDMPLLFQGLIGAAAVTAVELISGLILNIWLGLDVWDYSSLPFNFMGQICLYYFFLWILLSTAAIFIDDWLRHILFGEKHPQYRLF